MSDTVRKEMIIRLSVITRSAQCMQRDLFDGNLTDIAKQMQEIEQYSKLVRIDVNYMKALVRGGPLPQRQSLGST